MGLGGMSISTRSGLKEYFELSKRLTEASHHAACQPGCGPHRPTQS